MDVRLFCAVLWRFKRLVLGGFFLAAVLAVLAYGTPTFAHGKPSIVPRGAESWQSQAELLITQSSFPYGRATLQYTPGSPKTNTPSVPVGDQQYMSGLAPVYAALANGNVVQGLINHAAHVPSGSVSAAAVSNPINGQGLPFVDLTATATTSAGAATLASTAGSVLGTYVSQQQTAAGIAPSNRIELQLVQNGRSPQLVSGHKPTISVLVFVAVFGAAIALAFILESMRPKTAVRLGRIPGDAGQGSLAGTGAAASLDPGPAVVRLDHLLAGMHAPDPEFAEHHDTDPEGGHETPARVNDRQPRGGPADRQHRGGQALHGQGDRHLSVTGEAHAPAEADAPAPEPSIIEPDATAVAAKSLWDTAQQHWAASRSARQARSDSGG